MAALSVATWEDRLVQLRDRLARAAGVRRAVGMRRFPYIVQPWVPYVARFSGSTVSSASTPARDGLDRLRGKESEFTAWGLS